MPELKIVRDDDEVALDKANAAFDRPTPNGGGWNRAYRIVMLICACVAVSAGVALCAYSPARWYVWIATGVLLVEAVRCLRTAVRSSNR